MAQNQAAASFFHHFATLEDPRIERCQRHKLGDILFLAVAAMLGGANDFVAMEKFGHAKGGLAEELSGVAQRYPLARHHRACLLLAGLRALYSVLPQLGADRSPGYRRGDRGGGWQDRPGLPGSGQRSE